MISLPVFSWIVFLSILLPVLALVVLLVLPMVEKEIDFLEIENTKVQLQNQLQQSEFLHLSQQIHPHFMFNTLNALMSLGRLKRNGDMIRGMENFSKFLRYKYVEKDPLVRFETELSQIKNYLYIQKLRFGKKLSINYFIDPDAHRTKIPPYTLQTLVENAFQHGLERKSGEKRLDISLVRRGNWVELTVIDNGAPADNNLSATPGIGLKNIEQRLKLLFDLHTSVSLSYRNSQETKATVIWPYTVED